MGLGSSTGEVNGYRGVSRNSISGRDSSLSYLVQFGYGPQPNLLSNERWEGI